MLVHVAPRVGSGAAASRRAGQQGLTAPRGQDRLDRRRGPASGSRAALKAYRGALAEFVTQNPARNSLLLRRVIPGFEPSAASYAVAQVALGASTA